MHVYANGKLGGIFLIRFFRIALHDDDDDDDDGDDDDYDDADVER